MNNNIIGFTVIMEAEEKQAERVLVALSRVLIHFPSILQSTIQVGDTTLFLWGRGNINQRVSYLPDGTLLALIGCPENEIPWENVHASLLSCSNSRDFEIPWEGRFILLRISPDGEHWTMWNDWIGSIPVFHVWTGTNFIASTLEPLAVEGSNLTPSDFYLSGLISLLAHGNFIGDWTLYKSLKVVPSDCVAEWGANIFKYEHIFTVLPTPDRIEAGFNELVDEMYVLSHNAISESIKNSTAWIIPISGGLDSRLIAAIGAEIGVDISTYTWGPPSSSEVIYGHKLARSLGLPWKRVELGNGYLTAHTKLWSDLFGSSMHFHGMYQIPFFESLDQEPKGAIMTGFIGECLAGYDVRFQVEFHKSSHVYQSHPDGFMHWRISELKSLIKIPIDTELEEISSEIDRIKNLVEGPSYQSLRFLNLWGRQHRFTHFFSTLCDYWRRTSTPYLNKSYARFSLSLPRALLDDRYLQKEMFRRYYYKLAAIPGTYAAEPIALTGRYLFRRRLAEKLPGKLCFGTLSEFNTVIPVTESECLKNDGWLALWPIKETWSLLSTWFHMNILEETFLSAIHGDIHAVRKLQSIQAFAFRLLDGLTNIY